MPEFGKPGAGGHFTEADKKQMKFRKDKQEADDIDDLERALLALPSEELDTELVKQFITYRRGYKEDQENLNQAPLLDCLDDFEHLGKKLTWKQRRFVETMIANPSLPFKEAMKRIGGGYGASVHGGRQFKLPQVKEAMKVALKYVNERYGFDTDKVWRLIIDRATVDIGDIAEWDSHGNVTLKSKSQMSRKARRGVKSISVTRGPGGTETTKVELWDPYPYIRDLQKLYKMAEPTTEERLGTALLESMSLGRQRALENRVAPIEGEFTTEE